VVHLRHETFRGRPRGSAEQPVRRRPGAADTAFEHAVEEAGHHQDIGQGFDTPGGAQEQAVDEGRILEEGEPLLHGALVPIFLQQAPGRELLLIVQIGDQNQQAAQLVLMLHAIRIRFDDLPPDDELGHFAHRFILAGSAAAVVGQAARDDLHLKGESEQATLGTHKRAPAASSASASQQNRRLTRAESSFCMDCRRLASVLANVARLRGQVVGMQDDEAIGPAVDDPGLLGCPVAGGVLRWTPLSRQSGGSR